MKINDYVTILYFSILYFLSLVYSLLLLLIKIFALRQYVTMVEASYMWFLLHLLIASISLVLDLILYFVHYGPKHTEATDNVARRRPFRVIDLEKY